MSDDQPPQQQEQAALPAGDRWGDAISEGRQRELQTMLDAWAQQTDHGDKKGPFDGAPLTGADVFWLAERVRYPWGSVRDLHLEGAFLGEAHLETLYVNPPSPAA